MLTFEQTGLSPDILNAVSELGFENPTPIQAAAIPFLLTSNNDLIGLAQTGTGKTAAFGLPLIDKIDTGTKHVGAMVLCPTRELCIQITKDLKNYAKHTKGFLVSAVYGGASIETQIKELRQNPQIVVGTPGRVNDLIRRKKLKLNNLRYLVLDEADEMMNMGFKEELDDILAETPKEKQTLLFSATMPNDVLGIINRNMQNPEKITIGKRNEGAENVKHVYYMTHAGNRYLALKRIVDVHPKIYGIVFCRTRKETKDVAEKLMQDGYSADALHGDLSQAQRDQVMGRFRTRNIQILVATDVAARGLDVNDLSHVINYNLPDDIEIYIHRSGRTGRAGKNGTSVTIIHSREINRIRAIEKKIGKKVEREMIPNGREVCEKQLFNLVDRIEKVEVDDSQIEHFIDAAKEKLSWLSHEELMKRVIAVEFNRFLEYYKDARDLNIDTSRNKANQQKKSNGKKKHNKHQNFAPQHGYSKFFINMGKNQRLTKVKLIGMINDYSKTRSIDIGKIEILNPFSFFEIEKKHEHTILKAFRNAKHRGQKLNVELSV